MTHSKISADDDYGDNPDMSTDVEDTPDDQQELADESVNIDMPIALPPEIGDEDVTR